MAAHVVDVSRGADPLPGEPSEAQVQHWLAAALDALGGDAATISVRIVDGDEMAQLYKSYYKSSYKEHGDGPTNVLSFPDDAPGDGGTRLLGDIAICNQVVLDESAEYGVPFAERYAHMLIHGLLHLLGHDHQAHDERAQMEALECKLLQDMGMGNPYEVQDTPHASQVQRQ